MVGTWLVCTIPTKSVQRVQRFRYIHFTFSKLVNKRPYHSPVLLLLAFIEIKVEVQYHDLGIIIAVA